MAIPEEEWAATLTRVAPDLIRLAARRIDVRDRASVVQQTLEEAHRDRCAFNGQSDGELMAWLWRILRTNIADHFRARGRLCRNEDLEVPLDELLGPSAGGAGPGLAASGSSPEDKVSRFQRLLALLHAVQKLPELERVVIELHFLEELPLTEVARRLEKTYDVVGGACKRAVIRLNALLPRESEL